MDNRNKRLNNSICTNYRKRGAMWSGRYKCNNAHGKKKKKNNNKNVKVWNKSGVTFFNNSNKHIPLDVSQKEQSSNKYFQHNNTNNANINKNDEMLNNNCNNLNLNVSCLSPVSRITHNQESCGNNLKVMSTAVNDKSAMDVTDDDDCVLVSIIYEGASSSNAKVKFNEHIQQSEEKITKKSKKSKKLNVQHSLSFPSGHNNTTPVNNNKSSCNIIIDGNNVAFSRSEELCFDALLKCLNYFILRTTGKVSICLSSRYIPQIKNQCPESAFNVLVTDGILQFIPNDDVVVISTLLEMTLFHKGLLVTNQENYSNFVNQPAYKQIVDNRLIRFQFLSDVFMPAYRSFGYGTPTCKELMEMHAQK